MKTPTIAWALTLTSPGSNLGMNGNADRTTEAAPAAIQLSLFLGCVAFALQ